MSRCFAAMDSAVTARRFCCSPVSLTFGIFVRSSILPDFTLVLVTGRSGPDVGTRPLNARAQNTEDEPAVFIVRRPYRGVRHPGYLAAIMLFWSCVDFKSDCLLFNVLWTDWICLGTRLEQIDLCIRLFGDVYEKYRGRVPMLIPWHQSSWDVVRSLSQMLFPPQQFWMRRDSDPFVTNRLLVHPRRVVEEFAAKEMKRLVSWPPQRFGNFDLSVLVPGLAKRQPGSTAWHSPEPSRHEQYCKTPV
jgi:hypothetical protein